ncbi:MAG: hypothetical protein JWQ40_495 [Segetibacter sp.]|nr:hypothetical protein [Segetibacter sp.]
MDPAKEYQLGFRCVALFKRLESLSAPKHLFMAVSPSIKISSSISEKQQGEYASVKLPRLVQSLIAIVTKHNKQV